jgi:hypothetical protein
MSFPESSLIIKTDGISAILLFVTGPSFNRLARPRIKIMKLFNTGQLYFQKNGNTIKASPPASKL